MGSSEKTVIGNVDEAVETLTNKIEEAKKGNRDDRIALYAKLESLLADADELVNESKVLPERLVKFARRNLQLIVLTTDTEKQMEEAGLYLLEDAPRGFLEAFTFAAIVSAKESESDLARNKYEAFINVCVDKSRDTPAEEAVNEMVREAKEMMK